VKKLIFLLPDAIAFVGFVLFGIGLWRADPTFFFLGIGALLLLIGLWLSLPRSNSGANKGSNSKG